MRIGFMGSPAFAADILQDIHESVDVVVVYTREDAVRSRGKKLEPTPVKLLAQELGIEVRCPKTLKDADEQSYLDSLGLDAIVVAAYGKILPKAVLDIPRFGCINVHASLLPRWRGAAPIERAILAGDEFAGVCIMRMEEGLDTGDFCISRSIPIDDMGSEQLTAELASLGAVSLITALSHIEQGCARWVCQDELQVTYADKVCKGELNLSAQDPAAMNLRRVKAASAAHPSKCKIAGRAVSVLDARMPQEIPDEAQSATSGDVVYAAKKLYLICADAPIEVLLVKPDGKSEMDAKSFAAGSADVREGEAVWSGLDAS